jgi:hypothetical protein
MKYGPGEGEISNERGRVNERSQECDYGWCTLYTRINIEFLNLLK